jgi:hypothetical protein
MGYACKLHQNNINLAAHNLRVNKVRNKPSQKQTRVPAIKPDLEVNHVSCYNCQVCDIQVPRTPLDELPLRGAVANRCDAAVGEGLCHE